MIEIVLATHNGEKYLELLFDSLYHQSLQGWKVFVSDDNSSDDTLNILQSFSRRLENRMQIIMRDSNLGVVGNFGRSLSMCNARYVMLCDQDDVWLPDKIERTLKVMLETEQRLGSNIPILVHTDLKPVNDCLEPLSDSFWAYQHLDPARSATFRLNLVQNVVTGCTVMINRALLELALPIPEQAIMHDWWLTLVASAFGVVTHIDQPTILYRQHGANQVGAKRWGLELILRRAQNMLELEDSIERKIRQAQAFLERYDQKLSDPQRTAVKAFAGLRKHSFIGRRVLIVQHGFWFYGLARNLGWLIRV